MFRHLFLTILENRSPRSRCWQIQFLGRALCLACRSSLLTVWREREISHLLYVERERSLISSYKDTNPILGAPPSWPLLNLITSQKPHLLIPPHRGLEFQHMNLGATHSLHSTTSMKWKHNFLLLVLCKKIKCKALSTVLACRKAQNVLTMLLSFFIYAQSWIWNWFCINVSSWKLRLFTACNQTQQ